MRRLEKWSGFQLKSSLRRGDGKWEERNPLARMRRDMAGREDWWGYGDWTVRGRRGGITVRAELAGDWADSS